MNEHSFIFAAVRFGMWKSGPGKTKTIDLIVTIWRRRCFSMRSWQKAAKSPATLYIYYKDKGKT